MRPLVPFLTLALAVVPAGCAPAPVPAQDGVAAGATAGSTLLGAADRFLTATGVRLRYREIGQGQPVVLLHGYTDRIEMWQAAADSLARDHRVIVPDLRGFGASDKPTAPGSYGRRMSDDVIALLDSLGIARAHVAGYSMGALITADLAVRFPGRVASAVLVAGPFYPDSVTFARILIDPVAALERGEDLLGFFRWILPTWADTALVPAVRQVMADNDRGGLIGSLREMAALVPPDAAIRRTAIPAVAVVGRNDPMLEPTRSLVGRWPGIELVELEDADHAVVFAMPEVATAVRRLTRGAGRR